MQHSVKSLLNNVLKRSEISKGELFTLTKLAGKDALRIKPLKAFTNNIESYGRSLNRLNDTLKVSNALKQDISLLIENMELYHGDKVTFDDVFHPTKPIEISAYSVSALKRYMSDFDLSYFKMSEHHILSQSENRHEFEANDEESSEILSIYVLLKMYCDTFKQKNIKIYSDNQSVIRMLNKYSAKASKPYLRSPITNIASLCMEYKINPYWSRIVGVPQFVVNEQLQSISDPFCVSRYAADSQQ